MRLKQFLNEKLSASYTTTLQESLHCVGLGITQLNRSKLSVELLLNGDLFTQAYDQYCDVDIDVTSLHNFALESKSWTLAVVNNVNMLKQSGFLKYNNYTFYRGKGMMNHIYDTFNILKKKSKIRLNNDKQNPGDIWAVKSSVSIPTFDTLQDYNIFISKSLKNGSIVGISLKKSKGNPKVSYIDQGSDKPSLKYKGIRKPRSPFNTGITVLTSDPKISLNIRSFRTANVSSITSELNIKGSSARHGKKSLSQYVKKYGIPQMSVQEIKRHIDEPEYLVDMVISLWRDCGYTFSDSVIRKEWDIRSKKIDNMVGYFRSIINSLQIGAYMEQNKGHANDILSYIYLEASSMGDYSSDFIKVY